LKKHNLSRWEYLENIFFIPHTIFYSYKADSNISLKYEGLKKGFKMKFLLSILIIMSISAKANDRPTSNSAPNYNSIMDPVGSTSTTSTTTTTGSTSMDTPTNSTDSVSTGAASTVRTKTTRKTLEESCEKINGKMVCNQQKQTKIKRSVKNADAKKDESTAIPDSDLE
jgi:hypothetical protein